MSIVHRHKRRTASGKTATVRQYTRDGEVAAERKREAWEANAAQRWTPPPRGEASETPPADETWLDDDVPRHEPWMDDSEHEPEHSPAFAAMLKQNPNLGDGYEKIRCLRESGYTGGIDQDGNPTDPKAARKAAREAERQRQREAHERWEADMKADAERRGLPAYRPLGTKASWWKKRN